MSNDVSQTNKRIAKNTLALYFRTFISMLVGLYTSRIMLKALGVDNYGINNVVGGIVSMSTLITGAMSQSISRYLTYGIGKGDKKSMSTIFSTSINAQIIMSVLTVIVLELFGLWFLYTQANIPDGRMEAAHWVFQCAIISFIIGLISSPYSALLVAYEHMGIYAYTSIVEVVLKLAIVFIIVYYNGDRLILLAILGVFVSLGMRFFYGWYCSKHFQEAKYRLKSFDKGLLKELSVFSGWNILTTGAWVFATQGVNMLVNVFFGVAYNAARGIAQTVNGSIQNFVGNFTMAFSPQITKSYAANDKIYAIHLANRGTKFAWMMMYIFIVPVCCEAETLLRLWLGQIPNWTVLFLRFAMFESLTVCIGQNLVRLVQADGNVKKYTLHVSIVAALVFPLVWLFYSLGAPVWIAYLIFILDFILINIVRFYDLKRLMPFSICQFVKDVICPCMIISVVSFIIPLIICYYMKVGLLRFIINVPVSVIWTCFCCFVFGLTKNERIFLKTKILSISKLKIIKVK